MTVRSAGSAIRGVALLGSLLFLVGACGGIGGSPDPSAPVVVTFEVIDERFKVLLTEAADIDTARRLLAGEDVPSIPNGRVLRETGINEGYSWSLDPNDIEFAAVTIEVCDGLPSDVETQVVTSDRYCPWSAVVIEVEPAG
jgi:hypothetical protein